MAILGSCAFRPNKSSATFESDADQKIDLSPMIDCVFILLIFFIVTTVFVEESGIEVNRPALNDRASFDTSDNVSRLEFSVTEEGLVTFRNRSIAIDAIKMLVSRETKRNPDVPVLISVEEGAKHELFAKVYGNAKAGGATRISFK